MSPSIMSMNQLASSQNCITYEMCLASATHNFKLVKITHLFSLRQKIVNIDVETLFIPNNSDFIC